MLSNLWVTGIQPWLDRHALMRLGEPHTPYPKKHDILVDVLPV
jgi:hypothetical protein